MVKIKYEVNVKVFLDGKYRGDIKPCGDGYAYYPKGTDNHGFIFTTIEEVKYDIEDN